MSSIIVAAYFGGLMLSLLMTSCSAEMCKHQLAVDMPNAQVLANGSAWDPDDQALYPPKTYWTEGSLSRGCPCSLKKPCLRKCCNKDSAMNFTSLECIPYKKPFQPSIAVDEMGSTAVIDKEHFRIIYGNFCFGYLLEPKFYVEDKFFIDYDNGTLTIPSMGQSGIGPDEFCLEYLPEIDTYLPYKCFTIEPKKKCESIRFILYPIGKLVSIIFLLISISVYCIIPKLRNLCGKCLICQMVSLLSSYISLATVQVFGDGLTDDCCVALGFFIYFSMLCFFFWLNVLCIDITLAFSNFHPFGGNNVEQEKKKFILYSLYAWGMPLLLTALLMTLELHPGVPDTTVKPRFKQTCWFGDYQGRMFYFVGPVGIIVAFNFVAFLVTAHKIYLINKNIQESDSDEDENPKIKRDRRRFQLYLKLYVVMGVTWILEILSSAIGGSACIWIFPDMINVLQGFFIFLILICNRKVFCLVRDRIHSKKEPMATEFCTRMDDEESHESLDSAGVTTKTNVIKLKRKNEENPKESN